MTPPENDQPEDDGGTFKLKPGGATPPPAPAAEEENLDRTMKIQRGAPSPQSSTPPPPPSPLGNPTGPAEPPAATYAETTVMPQQGGSQTGYQPGGPQTPPPSPLGAPPVPPQAPGQQPYGQQPPQPGGFPPPGPQQPGPGYPQPQTAPLTGEAPVGIKHIGLVALVVAGVSILGNIINMAVIGPIAVPGGVLGIAIAGAFAWYGWALPQGKVTAAGLRMTGIVLMMIGACGSVLALLMSLIVFNAIGLIMYLLMGAALGYASFLYITKDEVKAFIKGAPQHPGYPPQGGHPQQGYGQPQQQFGQPGFPPPPPGYQQGGQPPQPPYGR
ncbi:hypothetical protein AB0B28_03120 [Glycomyces sp. NPDC046736]|uniref:hypothetical protein n=1 Tax=Glycomyces sp. NPDC046736 TaxID=3155615 RepID=UPI0033E4D65B